MPQLYKRPPITEAVVEIRIQNAIGMDLLERVRDKLLENYPLPPQKVILFNFEIKEDAPTVQQQLQGYRLTAPDGAGLVTVGPNLISASRLAPYEGWEPFIKSARGCWQTWKRLVGWQRIMRIGVRYINRIDIPNVDDRVVNIDDYLKFSLQMPKLDLPALETFAVNAVSPLGKDDCQLILNSSNVPSPLVKNTSFILDIDISRENDLPQNDEGLWAFVDKIRAHKNFVFEGCVTDTARELFNQ
jgi:uncharacterized protein (TIGR04255 family)